MLPVCAQTHTLTDFMYRPAIQKRLALQKLTVLIIIVPLEAALMLIVE